MTDADVGRPKRMDGEPDGVPILLLREDKNMQVDRWRLLGNLGRTARRAGDRRRQPHTTGVHTQGRCRDVHTDDHTLVATALEFTLSACTNPHDSTTSDARSAGQPSACQPSGMSLRSCSTGQMSMRSSDIATADWPAPRRVGGSLAGRRPRRQRNGDRQSGMSLRRIPRGQPHRAPESGSGQPAMSIPQASSIHSAPGSPSENLSKTGTTAASAASGLSAVASAAERSAANVKEATTSPRAAAST